MDKVRLGIIGVGSMGSCHAKYIMEGEVSRCELVAVCDKKPQRLERFAELKKFTDSGELIRSGEVDAIIIATPHYDHTPITIDALNNNLHVLCEKPIAVHKADAERMIAAADAHPELKFQAMFQLRTENTFKKLRQLIKTGELGEIVRITYIATAWFRTEAYYASGDWRATWAGEGGGILLNQFPHNLDQLQWLFGMPSKIRAYCGFGKRHDIEVEDEVTAYMEYPNGATAVVIASTGEAPGTDRLEIAGERGKVVLEGGKITFVRNEVPMTEFSKTSDKGFAVPPVWNIEIPAGKDKTGHAVITQNFIDAILDGVELMAPAREGINGVELANAMLYSAWTDTTVHLPLDSAAYEAALKEKCATSRYGKKQVKEIVGEDITTSFK